jgi:hypothetical protein
MSSETYVTLCSRMELNRCFAACCLLRACLLLSFFFDPEGIRNMFIRNIGWRSTDYAPLYPAVRTSNPASTLQSSGTAKHRSISEEHII